MENKEREFETFQEAADYWKEMAIIEFTEQIVQAMQRGEIKRRDLAEKLGTSKSHVTQLLAGTNLTFGTAAALAHAIGGRFRPIVQSEHNQYLMIYSEPATAKAVASSCPAYVFPGWIEGVAFTEGLECP
jgi:hypothetical protein